MPSVGELKRLVSPSSGDAGAVPAAGGPAAREGGVHVVCLQLGGVVRVQVRVPPGGRRHAPLRRRQEVVRDAARLQRFVAIQLLIYLLKVL